MNRRSYAYTLVSCLAGAGLALYAVTRVWSLRVVERPGMSALRTAHTGADLQPWVVGLALVALAGTGALLATRGRVRRGLGGVLLLVGAAIAVGALIARAGLDPGAAGAAGTFWPVACAAGGAIVAVGGLTAARHGHRWPLMSARYERGSVPPPRTGPGAPPGPLPAAGLERAASPSPDPSADQPLDSLSAWEALDRGDDPTVR